MHKIYNIIKVSILPLFFVCCNLQSNHESLGVKPFSVPFSISSDKKIVVEAVFCKNIKDSFAIDNGASITVLDKNFFYTHFDTSIFTLVNDVSWADYQEYDGDFLIELGAYQFSIGKVIIKNLSEMGESARNGIIGSGAFVNKMTEINFDKKCLFFYDSLPEIEGYEKIPMKKLTEYENTNRWIYLNGFYDKKNKPIRAKIHLDLGASVNVLPISFFNKMNSEIIKNTVKYRAKAGGIFGAVEMDIIEYSIDSLQIGSIYLQDMQFISSKFPDKENVDTFNLFGENEMNLDGFLGIDFFKRFHTILDYKNNILYLKPRANWKDI